MRGWFGGVVAILLFGFYLDPVHSMLFPVKCRLHLGQLVKRYSSDARSQALMGWVFERPRHVFGLEGKLEKDLRKLQSDLLALKKQHSEIYRQHIAGFVNQALSRVSLESSQNERILFYVPRLIQELLDQKITDFDQRIRNLFKEDEISVDTLNTLYTEYLTLASPESFFLRAIYSNDPKVKGWGKRWFEWEEEQWKTALDVGYVDRAAKHLLHLKGLGTLPWFVLGHQTFRDISLSWMFQSPTIGVLSPTESVTYDLRHRGPFRSAESFVIHDEWGHATHVLDQVKNFSQALGISWASTRPEQIYNLLKVREHWDESVLKNKRDSLRSIYEFVIFAMIHEQKVNKLLDQNPEIVAREIWNEYLRLKSSKQPDLDFGEVGEVDFQRAYRDLINSVRLGVQD
jgi:hypothetical protein